MSVREIKRLFNTLLASELKDGKESTELSLKHLHRLGPLSISPNMAGHLPHWKIKGSPDLPRGFHWLVILHMFTAGKLTTFSQFRIKNRALLTTWIV